MKTGTLFFALICIFFTSYAADDKVITLQSNDGAYITIPTSVAQHSQTLANIIGDCPVNQTVPVPSFDAQELKKLADILNTIHQAMSNEDAIISLRNNFTSTFELNLKFLNLCCLDNFFDIPVLEKMLLHYIVYAPSLPKHWAARDSKTIAQLCQKLQETSVCPDMCHKNKIGLQHLISIIKDAQLNDKKQFLESKGKIKGPFFMGVSVGELTDYHIIDTRYKSLRCDEGQIAEARVQYPQEDIPVSIEGLICNRADYITDINKKILNLVIACTNIESLPANSFQRTHNPHSLRIFGNTLVNIHPEAFAGLYSLKTLWLSGDKTFINIHPGTLDHLRNLKSLDLSDTSFNPLLLQYCSKLKKLYLKNNRLIETPTWWPKACSRLKDITIQSNQIQSLPASFFDYFPQLQRLSLAYNNISHINATEFKNCKHLTYLNLKKNPIAQEEINILRAALPNINIEF